MIYKQYLDSLEFAAELHPKKKELIQSVVALAV